MYYLRISYMYTMYLDHIHPFNFSLLTPFRFPLQVSNHILFLISYQVPISADLGLSTRACLNYTLKKNDSLSLHSNQLTITPYLGVGPYELILLSILEFGLTWSHTFQVTSSTEFISEVAFHIQKSAFHNISPHLCALAVSLSLSPSLL